MTVNRYDFRECPRIGPILAAVEPSPDGALVCVRFGADTDVYAKARSWSRDVAALDEFFDQLSRYLDGRLREFDVALQPAGTAFQLAVWAALRTIPYGQTASYGQIARMIDRPTAVRAVGAANGQNPLPIVIPCHRVIGSDGSLTGFGGGLAVKEALLDVERGAAGLFGG